MTANTLTAVTMYVVLALMLSIAFGRLEFIAIPAIILAVIVMMNGLYKFYQWLGFE